MTTSESDLPLPDALKKHVKDIGKPVSTDDVDTYGKLREIEDRSHQVRTIVRAWKDQQTQDRKMRNSYARWLMAAMGVQAVVANVAFFLVGTGWLTVDEWTARTFILAVYGEIAALVLIVVKYLFTPSSDKILSFLNDRTKKGVGDGD